MSNHLTPVDVCLKLIGPLPVLEAAVGYQPKSGYVWLSGTKNRDAGDFPTTRLMRRLLAHAAAKNIPLTAEHLIWGAPADEIDALCAQMSAGAPPAFASSRLIAQAAAE